MKTNYIALSIPVFFILIGVELLVCWIQGKKYYRLNDSLSNLAQGIGQQVTGIFFKVIISFFYIYLYDMHKIFDIPNALWVWVVLFFCVDFFYYWFHRMSHEVNAMWAAHIVHHQSEDYNLTVALRQSWFQSFFSLFFYLPLALVGFDPIMFVTVSSFNTLYQFWIHTQTIGKLGPLEWIFNTPSHHRVHHGSNPKYIDKNHAGSLIIWDRLFGTFQEEEEEVYYGITRPLNSWNPIWANFHYWAELWQLSKRSSGLKNKLLVFLMPPGWQPKELGGRQFAKEIDPNEYRKYDNRSHTRVHRYAFFQFVLILGAASILLFVEKQLTSYQVYGIAFSVIGGLVAVGAYFENNRWALGIDLCRLLLIMVVLSTISIPLLKYSALLFGISIIGWIKLALSKPSELV
jgi:sterol desaturase/sphingolipid hydroxylase (fatty acid hydroxylase superfamily)